MNYLCCLLLQEEKVEHAQTRGRLNEVVDKLEEAVSQVKLLQEQLQHQQTLYEKMYVASLCQIF